MSDLWLQLKYANLLSSSLENFKNKSKSDLYYVNFRCPICGDSAKNKYKTRGWIYQNKNKLNFKCFNCDNSMSFISFMKHINENLYNDFRFEAFKEYKKENNFSKEISKEKNIEYEKLNNVKSISELDIFHPAKKYISNRKIPKEKHSSIYYVEKFYKWVNENFIPNKFDKKTLEHDEPRIIFPIHNLDNKIVGIQGRSLNKNSTLRYITLMLKEDSKVFGLNSLNKKIKTYVVEGPIDSLFLNNCVAMVGADAHLDEFVDKQLTTIIFDNEPRNKEIVKRINKYISQGWSVCIWPDNMIKYGKDINDFILSGYSANDITKIIDDNTFKGLKAELRFSSWKKI